MRSLLLACALLPSCSQVVRYTDALIDANTGRTLFVRIPAATGIFVGFVAGIPFDVAALPISYPYYISQPKDTRLDVTSVFLFPSFVLWRVGALIAVPFDAVEYAVWRGWAGPGELTPENRARLERLLDEKQFPDYPVTPLYPLPELRQPGGDDGGGGTP